MDIINLELEDWTKIVLRFNWVAFFIMMALLLVIYFVMKKLLHYFNKNSITINEVNLGIGNSSVSFSYNNKDREIAYKIWVELSTRKIGLPFDEQNDVIKEVYDSWYAFFGIVRELLKDIPGNRILYSDKLIDLTEKVLNAGLRPHLTKWQAKFRRWYEKELENDSGTPQDIQKNYPEYKELVKDLIKTNKKMIVYKEYMKQIAFGKKV